MNKGLVSVICKTKFFVYVLVCLIGCRKVMSEVYKKKKKRRRHSNSSSEFEARSKTIKVEVSEAVFSSPSKKPVKLEANNTSVVSLFPPAAEGSDHGAVTVEHGHKKKKHKHHRDASSDSDITGSGHVELGRTNTDGRYNMTAASAAYQTYVPGLERYSSQVTLKQDSPVQQLSLRNSSRSIDMLHTPELRYLHLVISTCYVHTGMCINFLIIINSLTFFNI